MYSISSLAWLFWNPSREAFTLPFFHLSIAWYGILFTTGFIVGYFMTLFFMKQLLVEKWRVLPAESTILSAKFVDQLVWLIIIGTIVGARLGHVLFYDLGSYIKNPLEIFMLRNGGLASHGGTLGIMVGLMLFLHWNKIKFPKWNFVSLLDVLVIPTAVTATFIRLGNFVNQEIVGTPSTLPWAVIFGDASDGSLAIPRHPVQLYEAAAYFLVFIGLYVLKRIFGANLKEGILSGCFFIAVFGSRIFLEFWKEHQGAIVDQSFLQMGQYLSIPFVLFGIWLLSDSSFRNIKNT